MTDHIYGVLISPDELRHFGVKGMRWGVRRKNPSGGRSGESSDSRTARSLSKRKLSSLSNDELAKLNKRMQLERTYNSLKPPSIFSSGKKFVGEVVRDAGKNTAASFVQKGMTSATQTAIKKVLESE